MARSGLPRSVVLKPKAPPAVLRRAAMAARRVWPIDPGCVALFEDRIAVRDRTGNAEALPRRYTLAQDTGSLAWLSIGAEYGGAAPEGQPLGERSEVLLAELVDGDPPCLRVRRCAQSRAIEGSSASPARRQRRFEKELPLLLAVLRYGDRFFFERHPEWDHARVIVEGCSNEQRGRRGSDYGRVTDYRVTAIAGESRRLAFGAAALAVVSLGALFLVKRRKQDGG